MIDMLKKSFAIALGVLLSACGTVGKTITDDYTFKAAGQMGLIAVSSSLVDQCGRVGGMTAFIRHKEKPGTDTQLIVKNMLMSPNFSQPPGHFFVF